MKIIYHCYGGTHTSPLAAAIHLDNFCFTGKINEFESIPFFDKQSKNDAGRIYYMGRDEYGNAVYFVGTLGNGKLLEQVLQDFCSVFNFPREDFLLIDVMPCLNMIMRIGGFISRALGMVFPGRILVKKGVALSYPCVSNKVSTAKEILRCKL